MSNFRRWFVPGGTYFFTLVTEGRQPLFADERAREFLRKAIEQCQERWPFRMGASVVLPDHLHMIWCMPSYDHDYPRRLAFIKRTFSSIWLESGAMEQPVTASKSAQRRRGVWQRRYWEHTIVDDQDFENHVDYIHYNPVKHGLVPCPHLWTWSTFHQWVKRDAYPVGWGCCCGEYGVKPEPVVMRDMSRTAGE
jgi:putative transposase